MKRKGDTHENLSLLFKKYGVPPKKLMDGLKEQTLGSFRKEYQEADCHINIWIRTPLGNYMLRGI